MKTGPFNHVMTWPHHMKRNGQEGRRTASRIGNKARNASQSLAKNNADPCNADRALWGECAMVTFVDVAGLKADLQVDPETALGDLLADLMHWCDAQNTRDSLIECINFESALKRARGHYREEFAAKRNHNTRKT